MTRAVRARASRRAERRIRAWSSAATSFCLIGLFILAITIYSTLHQERGKYGSTHGLTKRDALDPAENLECRLVHRATDKCAFIKANCPDEEAGLFSYLQLYYCDLASAKPVAFGIIVLWLCLLFSTIGIAASDFFCINLSTIAQLLGLSESLAGVTFLAFGNGSPDVFSTFAAMNTNSGSLAIGELIGAAGFITAVVAGAMAFVRPFKVARRSFVRDVCFFILAASFAMAFLIDGKLYLWEALAMVGLYVFYVMFVVVWHWYFNRRKKRKQAEAVARAHFVAAGSEVVEFPEYHDIDEPEQEGRPTPRRGMSAEDISLLERGRSFANDDEDEEADEDRKKRELGGISSEMRIGRPKMRDRGRSHVHNPVRPSLIGALEFRSVLSGLQRSGNIQSFPLHRRHSDDERSGANINDARSMTSEPASRGAFHITPEEEGSWNARQHHAETVQGLRTRAISAPDPSMIRQAAENVPAVDLLGPLAEEDPLSRSAPRSSDDHGHLAVPPSPSASFSPPASGETSRSASPAPSHVRSISSSHLAVPGTDTTPNRHNATKSSHSHTNSDPNGLKVDTRPQLPGLRIPSSTLPFPPYRDEVSPAGQTPSIRLPSPSVVIPDSNPIEELYQSSSALPPSWWPAKFLPTPFEMWATLFPTLYGWTGKNWWERILGVVAAPSVFFLTITLPVVESTSEDDESIDDDIPDLTLPSTYAQSPLIVAGDYSYASTIPLLVEPDENDSTGTPNGTSHHVANTLAKGLGGHGSSASAAIISQDMHQHANHIDDDRAPQLHPTNYGIPTILSPAERQLMQSPDQLPVKPPTGREWTRWLAILQSFTAPLFTALIFWAKTADGDPRLLIKPVLISLAVSLCFCAILILTTTPDRTPVWHPALCFVGFIVSITWISSIADEVVGVLKTIGVILNISDAILGLTIFAVGNSLGDLVADYTVAKLGYPVMALSACFGGPMLNILLGVGLSGSYITVKHAQNKAKKHPGKELKFKPYEIEVSRTLVISGATLLITLFGLLIIVPLRRWKMDRFIGWCLVILWSVSTVCNVLVEILGVGGTF